MKIAGILVLLVYIVTPVTSQLVSGTILRVLESTQGLRKFAQWISDSDTQHLYSGNEERTVFVFNDTVFDNLRSDSRSSFESMTSKQKEHYVMSYTLANVFTVDKLPNPGHMLSLLGRKLYFIKRNRNIWSNGANSGVTATYVNGAMIVREQIRTSNGVIHVLDRVPSQISTKMAYEWVKDPDNNIQTSYFVDMLKSIEGDYYNDVVSPLNRDRVTLFLPSQRALSAIPDPKRRNLQGQELAQYIQLHYIPGSVVYTSFVDNSENYQSGLTGSSSRIIFRRFEDKVYVISGGVTALVERGNITVSNGVIHIIDQMLGYVYNTAREQIADDAPRFSAMIDRVPTDLSQLISQTSGVNMFVPLDSAFSSWIDYNANMSLIDMVVRLCMVRDGSIEVSQMNANYDGRQRRNSRYNNWKLVIYNDRNDTWVNGGNVRARIVRPDIKVTTGRLQYIDQVLGVPNMDIPGVIYYDDHLYKTYYDLNMVGMAKYLQDARLAANNAYVSSLPFRDTTHLANMNSNSFNPTYTTQYPNQYPTQYPGQVTQYPNNIPQSVIDQQQYQGNNQYPNNQYPNNQDPNNQNPNNQYPNNQYPNNQDPNNQYPNNQYPNNQDPNNQYPNNQYPNNQYPNNNNQFGETIYPPNRESYGACGQMMYPCQFTFFVPNGTAIENFYRLQYGSRIVQEHNRYRFLFRRLIIPNRLIFLDQLGLSTDSNRYTTHSGETILVRKDNDNSVRIYWKSQSARVIMWDIGCTNGVVHIIDQMLSEPNDISIDISLANMLLSPVILLLASLSFLSVLFC